MNVMDFLAFLWMPFVTAISTIAVILLVAWLLLWHVTDPDAVKLIKRIRLILIIVIGFGFVIAALNTAAVHGPRTTIDRSLGDAEHDALVASVEQQGTTQ